MFLKSVQLFIVSIAVSVESEYLKFYKNYFLAKNQKMNFWYKEKLFQTISHRIFSIIRSAFKSRFLFVWSRKKFLKSKKTFLDLKFGFFDSLFFLLYQVRHKLRLKIVILNYVVNYVVYYVVCDVVYCVVYDVVYYAVYDVAYHVVHYELLKNT